MNAHKFNPGDKVRFNGDYPGTVIRYYSEGMIEVRGERGTVCIPEKDAEHAQNARAAIGKATEAQ